VSAHAAGSRPLRCAVVVVSDRGASGVTEDRSGPAAREALERAGHHVVEVLVVPDGEASVADALTRAMAEGVDVVLTSGGTGVGPRDLTPEGTRPFLLRELPGLAEALRRHGAADVPTAVLSRGLSGVTADGVVVVNLPGSPGAVRSGLEVLLPLLPHVVHQVAGGDHG
jgi:molybdenum cofactor synthesis domain-containing protein